MKVSTYNVELSLGEFEYIVKSSVSTDLPEKYNHSM
jgi:hypothetical protein